MSRYLERLQQGGRWHEALRCNVARAVYAELALAIGGSWAPGDVERAILLANGQDRRGEGLSNKFRKMLTHDNVPSPATLAEAERAFPGAAVRRWANHPLFYLLDPRQSESEGYLDAAIRFALEQVPDELSESLHRDRSWDMERVRHFSCGPTNVSEFVRKRSFEQLPADLRLTMYVCLAKGAQRDGEKSVFANLAFWGYLHFPELMVRCPHLVVAWQPLAALLDEQIWRPGSALSPPDLRFTASVAAHMASAIASAAELNMPLPPLEFVSSTASVKRSFQPDSVA